MYSLVVVQMASDTRFPTKYNQYRANVLYNTIPAVIEVSAKVESGVSRSDLVECVRRLEDLTVDNNQTREKLPRATQ